MGLEIRSAREDELDELVRCDAVAFGLDLKDEDYEEARAFLEIERTLVAAEDGRVVGSAAVVSLELTLPGAVVTPVAGVTMVAVLPTHRRRGILTAMMRRLLADAHGQGEAVAGLLASESVIYGRFGYGPATSSATFEIERPYALFSERDEADGRVVVLEGDVAETVLPDLFDRYRRARPGEVSRNAGWWKAFFADREDEREGLSRRFHVAHERSPGDFDGYVTYRYRRRWDGVPDYTASVEASWRPSRAPACGSGGTASTSTS